MNHQDTTQELSFEQAIEKLESILESLSNPGETLNRMISLYEEGVAYLNVCKKRLVEAEAKVSVLNEKLLAQNQQEL